MLIQNFFCYNFFFFFFFEKQKQWLCEEIFYYNFVDMFLLVYPPLNTGHFNHCKILHKNYYDSEVI